MAKIKRLLIIDDEENITNMVKQLLEDYADEIYTANRGKDGLKLLEQHNIHCVICDIMMPEMKGTEVIKVVRESGNEVPFIFYTAFGSQDLMLVAAKYGAFDFISKPELDDLEEIVSRGLEVGLNRSRTKKPNTTNEDHLTEYQKLLNQVNKE